MSAYHHWSLVRCSLLWNSFMLEILEQRETASAATRMLLLSFRCQRLCLEKTPSATIQLTTQTRKQRQLRPECNSGSERRPELGEAFGSLT